MLAWAAVAGAATWTVDPSGGGDFTTVAAAIAAAGSGDNIEVGPGTYPEQLAFRGPDLTLVATGGPEVTFLEVGEGLALVLVDAGAVTIEGFDLSTRDARQCLRVRGGAITLRGAVVHGCGSTGLGGAMRLEVGTRAVIEASEFRDNATHGTEGGQRAGHIYSRADVLEIRDSVFVGGVSELDAGGLGIVAGEVVLERNTFEGQSAGLVGGAIHVDGAPRTFDDGSVGAGVSSLVLTENRFTGNVAGGAGGAVWLTDVPSFTFERNLFCGNSAGTRGGAVFVGTAGAGSFTRDIVQENEADEGGGLYLGSGEVTVDGADLLGNAATSGGALAAGAARLTLTNDAVAWSTGTAVVLDDETEVVHADWNAWWQNDPADAVGLDPAEGDALGDPRFVDVTLDGDCTNDDWTPLVTYADGPAPIGSPWGVDGSALVDAGDPDQADEDGSRRDIGAVAWVRPPYVAPPPPVEEEGCGCAAGGSAAGAPAVALALALSRRRRRMR